MEENDRGQVSSNAAEIYDEFYLPALFNQWPPHVIEAARIQSGQRVADVACGTGVLSRAVSECVGSDGSVVGIDPNEGMLAVARRKAPQIEWLGVPAEELPFENDSFDAVVSQFGLMYFDDQHTALREMMRVLRPGGYLAVAVWDRIENSPGHFVEDELWRTEFGEEAADIVPYSLGDRQVLADLFADAGIRNASIKNCAGTARYPSIDDWVYASIKGWTLADQIDDEQYERILAASRRELAQFEAPGGMASFPLSTHIVSATKP